jgi:hypothetical protein
MWTVEWASPYEARWNKYKFQGKNAADRSHAFWRKTVNNYHRQVKVFLIETVDGKKRNIHSEGGK